MGPFGVVPLREDDESARLVWLGFTLSSAIWATAACTPEPCLHVDQVAVAQETTPFANGDSVFSKCSKCPELPKTDGITASGPATACDVTFNEGSSRAYLDCLYGPGGNTSSAIGNDAVTDVPNDFGYCETHCPDHDALHYCRFTADGNGVQTFFCYYGRSCD